jgi:hypothetical protein
VNILRQTRFGGLFPVILEGGLKVWSVTVLIPD